MSKDTTMTASEEDRALAANIVASLPPFSQRTKRNDEEAEEIIAAEFAAIRARAAAEAMERAAKLICSGCARGIPINASGYHESAGGYTVPCHAAAIRADLTAGERDSKREA